MYIRSQDRLYIIPLTFASISIHNNIFHVTPFSGSSIRVGEYDSEEICKKVVDEIEEKINRATLDNFVYRMPSKESMQEFEDMNKSMQMLDENII